MAIFRVLSRSTLFASLFFLCIQSLGLAQDDDDIKPHTRSPSLNYRNLALAAGRGIVTESTKIGVVVLFGNPGGMATLAIGITGAQVAGWSYDKILSYLKSSSSARAATNHADFDINELIDEFTFIEEDEIIEIPPEVILLDPETITHTEEFEDFYMIENSNGPIIAKPFTPLSQRASDFAQWGLRQGTCCLTGFVMDATVRIFTQAIPGSPLFSAATGSLGSDLTLQLITPRTRIQIPSQDSPELPEPHEPITRQLNGWETRFFYWNYKG